MYNASLHFRVSVFCRLVFVGTLLITLLSAVFPTISHAQGTGFGVTLKAGTPGIGGDLTMGWHPKFNARLGINVFWYGLEDSETDEEGVTTDFQADLKWLTVPLLLDWHPWENGLRLSLGAMINNNNVDLSADSNSVEINDVEYQLQNGVDGKITFNTFSPYLGIGYGNAADQTGHWHFACDLGVMFQGSPKIEVNAVAANPLLQAALDADLDAEVDEMEDDFKDFTMYPVVSFGISYTF